MPAIGIITSPPPTADSGNFTFQDSYGQLYHNQWQWNQNHTILDITTITEQPYVWGEPNQIRIQDRNIFYRGIVTIFRQTLHPLIDGYEIIAEGTSQVIDWIQTSFHCATPPIDPFHYHLNQSFSDQVQSIVTSGPRMADPEEANDSVAVWAPIGIDGTATATGDTLEFIDIWSN